MKRPAWFVGSAAAAMLLLAGCLGPGAPAERAAPAAAASPGAASAGSTGSGAPPDSSASAAASPAAGSAGAAGERSVPGRDGSADATAALRTEVLRLIGTAACRADDQCRALPLGSKPCGGPETYLAWSASATDARALEEAAARYRAARERRNRELGLMSDCAVVPEPAVRCVAAAGGEARCVAAPRARGAPLPATR